MDRIREFTSANIDMIFILNDLWIINEYISEIKKYFNPVPPIVLYFPVDAKEFDERWFENFDVVKEAVVYTQFGYDVVKKAAPIYDFHIVPHGIDTKIFHTLETPKVEIKKMIYPDTPALHSDDTFIVLNANRNQPRKRLDIALEGFGLFAEGKPENVKYYHHAGIRDVGWNIPKLARRYGLDKRLLLTGLEEGVQKIPDDRLNMIYNGTDVGLNTSMGEGWGLPSMEHAVTGAPQIVADNSASAELYHDIGLLVPTIMDQTFERVETVGRVCRPEDVAEALQKLYDDRDLMKELGQKGKEKFLSPEYDWANIGDIWTGLFRGILGI